MGMGLYYTHTTDDDMRARLFFHFFSAFVIQSTVQWNEV